MSADETHHEPQPVENAIKTDTQDSHDDHTDSHGLPADAIPVNSPQDMVLKLVTCVAAFLVCGSFIWWWTLPLPAALEIHEGHEAPAGGAVEHH